MKWILLAGAAKWKLQNGNSSILQNGNGNRKMEMIPFQNGSEMDSTSWDAKMEIAQGKWIHFPISILILEWKWKWT